MAPTATPTAARTPIDIPATCSVESLLESSLSSSLLAPPAPPDTSVVVSVSELEVDVVVVELVNGGSVIEIISGAVVASSGQSVEESSLVVDLILVFVDGLGIIGGDDVSTTRVVGNV
jgi:hypothetical protein